MPISNLRCVSEIPETVSSNGHGPITSEPGADGTPLRLGGMAMRNGLLVHGPTHWAAASRNKNGRIDVASGRKPNFGGNKVTSVPLLRGPVRMAEAFAVIPIARRSLPSSRLAFEDPRVVATATGVSLLSNLLKPKPGEPKVLREAAIALLGLAPPIVALSGTELAEYHGVEHKAIAAYEQGDAAAAAAAPKEHERCGSNLIAPMMIFTVAGQLILEKLENPGPVARAAVSIGTLSLAVEIFAFAEKRPNSILGKAVHASGHAIQSLFATREPSAEQLEVGTAAMDAILGAEGV